MHTPIFSNTLFICVDIQERLIGAMADSELERRMSEQQIPDEVLQELLTLSQENPELFSQILQSYPQIAEMLQQDINSMNGGNINE